MIASDGAGHHAGGGRACATALIVLALGGCASHAPRPVRHLVVIAKVAYAPPVVDAAAGDTIEWRNQDLVPHTVTARRDGWDSGVLLPDSSWRLVVSGRDSLHYDCRLHPTMHGVVFVRGR